MATYPECDKLAAIENDRRIINEFLEGLNSKGIHLCTYNKTDGGVSHYPLPVNKKPDTLIAEHFGIDMKKVEKERQQMIRLQGQGRQRR